ncbi:MAG: PEP-CTERM sorting domain-containing protein [Candidatus Nealsonbacteria bacterium]|nr:PEP-CTERM sorting domain-containing protein [Candidatus Nealsonbacteria bacterium]
MRRATGIAVVFVGLVLAVASAVQSATISYPLGDPPEAFMPQPGEITVLIREDLIGDYQKDNPAPGEDPLIRNVVPIQFVANVVGTKLSALGILSEARQLRYDTTWWDDDAQEFGVNPAPFQFVVLHGPGHESHGIGLLTSSQIPVFPMPGAPKVFDTRVLITPGDYDVIAEYIVVEDIMAEDILSAGVKVVPVPEPGTIAMLLTGLMGGAVLVWRRKK